MTSELSDSSIPLIPLRERETVFHAPFKVTYLSGGTSDQSRQEHTKGALGKFLSSIREQLPEGWRFNVTLAAIFSTVVLIINIAIAVLSFRHLRRKEIHSSFAPIFSGNCANVKHISLVIHLAINAASSLLLSGTNSCMQSISSPTRRNIDKAHQSGTWLDIGVPSIRNLRFLGYKRLLLWISLGASSIPLHLVTNSTQPLNIASQYPNGTLYNTTLTSSFPPGFVPSIQANSSRFQKLDKAECIAAYAKRVLPERRNVILIVSNTPYDGQFETGFGNRCFAINQTIIFPPSSGLLNMSVDCIPSLYSATNYKWHTLGSPDPFFWMCSDVHTTVTTEGGSIGCNSESLRKKLPNWTIYGFSVQHCLSEQLESQCSLHVSLNLLVLVIIFNTFKVCMMLLTLFVLRDKPLVTIGDAVDSFLTETDPCTSGQRLLTKDDVLANAEPSAAMKLVENRHHSMATEILAWKAASKRRWSVAFFLTTIALLIILIFLFLSISTLKEAGVTSFHGFLEIGMGTVDPRALIKGWNIPQSGDGATVGSILVANSTQLVLSFIYMIFNSIFTSIFVAIEWGRYAQNYQALRVSHPRGRQRSTYFLQVPYRFALPIIIFAVVLHWLVSQSIFLAKIDDLQSASDSITTCGFSPVGMIATFVVGLFFLMFAIILGKMALPSEIPLVGSCSLAISAACHAPEDTSPSQPLIWGPIPTRVHDNDCSVGPYGFTNPPTGTRTY